MLLLSLLFLSLFDLVVPSAPRPTHGVVSENDELKIVLLPFNKPMLAWGGYNDTIHTDGWSYLAIYSNETVSNALQARAAGFIEGALTHQRIWEFATNHNNDYSWSPKLRDYVDTNNKWMNDQIKRAASIASGTKDSIYWEQVSLLLEQQKGLYAGYNKYAASGQTISEELMLSLSMHSDMDTLCPLFGGCGSKYASKSASSNSATAKTMNGKPDDENDDAPPSAPPSAPNRMKDHCSVIVKLVPKKNELYTAHTTWTGFEDMTRIFKMYDLPYSFSSTGSTSATETAVVPGSRIAFSSYPGNLFSTDDWYTLSSGLAVTETTIDNHNTTLWKHVVPTGTVLTWIRTMVANRLATNGPDWASSFSKYNSGTYNNEFHVVDYNLFEKYTNNLDNSDDDDDTSSLLLPLNVLTIVDQMPGHVEIMDMTSRLNENGYWSSYNRPGLPKTYAIANYTETVKEYGNHYSHQYSSRGQLFQLLHSQITDEDQLKRVMRFNQFNNSNLPKSITNQMCASGPSASNAISERGDLTPLSSNCGSDVNQQDEGGIDMKYTTAQLMKEKEGLGAVAQSGPTYDDQPVFVWSNSPFKNVSHVGQPDRWEFPYVVVDWFL
jgi:hypothetical protein